MHICLFTPTFLPLIGGAEANADLLARGLGRRGHEVRVLCPDYGPIDPPPPYPVHHYRRPPSQHLWPELLQVPLYRLHRRWPYDVVLAFYSYPTGYAASRLKRRLGFGLVISPRGYDLYDRFHGWRKPRVRRTVRAGYAGADRIVSISGWLVERLRRMVGDEAMPPYEVVYNGIDLAAHDARLEAVRDQPTDMPVAPPFALHLASVTPIKAQTLAVEAVRRLADRFRSEGMQYAIAGDGAALEAVRRQVADAGVEDIVKLLGYRRGVEKDWLLAHASFMVTTSLEEALGTVNVEAIVSGQPLLASDLPAHRELIDGRGWGMLFRSGDVDDLTEKLERMLSGDLDPLRQAALASRHEFSLEHMIDRYEAACVAATDEADRRRSKRRSKSGSGA